MVSLLTDEVLANALSVCFSDSPANFLFATTGTQAGIRKLKTGAIGLVRNVMLRYDVEVEADFMCSTSVNWLKFCFSLLFQVFRLVSRGTIEEQKYLRQVYKKQWKKETSVDIDDPERAKAARLFRAVDKDSGRRYVIFLFCSGCEMLESVSLMCFHLYHHPEVNCLG